MARGAPSALGATACTLVLPGGAHAHAPSPFQLNCQPYDKVRETT